LPCDRALLATQKEDGVHVAVADMADGRDISWEKVTRTKSPSSPAEPMVSGKHSPSVSPETVKLVEAAGRNALAVVCDVSKEDSVAAMAKQVQAKFSHVDIVVNCAGIYPQRDFADMTFADWRKVLSINLDGTFLVTAAFVPGMRARKWGRIVNLASSTFGSVTTGFAHYVASKGGIIGFTRAGGRFRWRRHHGQRHRAGAHAFTRHTGAKTAPRLRRHGRRICRRR
jgi:NAD(P)-dependent dehydrogenase (short-subunit alcohol dehydrogenase family)